MQLKKQIINTRDLLKTYQFLVKYMELKIVKCSSCNTEIETESCPKCGLQQPKQKCKGCYQKFYTSFLVNGNCPACDQKEKNLPYKSPFMALVLSIVPGLGLYYAGNPAKGAAILIAISICIWIPIIGWFLIPFIWIWGAVDAYSTATRANANDGLKLISKTQEI